MKLPFSLHFCVKYAWDTNSLLEQKKNLSSYLQSNALDAQLSHKISTDGVEILFEKSFIFTTNDTLMLFLDRLHFDSAYAEQIFNVNLCVTMRYLDVCRVSWYYERKSGKRWKSCQFMLMKFWKWRCISFVCVCVCLGKYMFE